MSQIEHFDKRAYEYYVARNQQKNVFYRKLLFSYCLKGISIEKDCISVLEPMCGYGNGRDIIDIAFAGKQIFYEGFDSSKEIIGIAKKSHPNENFYVMDVLELSKKNKSRKYDVIIVIGGIHHIPDYAKDVVGYLFNTLAPGGIFINFEPTYNNSFMRSITSLIYRYNRCFEEHTERRFSLNEINYLYNHSGFKIKHQLYPGLLSYLLWYNPQIFKLLNIGGIGAIERLFEKEKGFFKKNIAKKWSVATFSILEKPS